MPTQTTVQPRPSHPPSFSPPPYVDKHQDDQHRYTLLQRDEPAHAHSYAKCHARRLQRVLLPAVTLWATASLVLLTILGIYTLCTLSDPSSSRTDGGAATFIQAFIGGLTKRATGDDNNNTFVNNKCTSKLDLDLIKLTIKPAFCVVYLIVLFVGLVVVLILAIMFSAWCCRGK
ncbi:hypothetical protein AMATHDRAFT_51856 [Amanita thiersii Skay4041]|uniref:Uncharacterized protein n=1 Tax=Amanita thiersii Skay4041 TaxID=703135 RepID=A0A2A9N672_9AGAR|nr:hypothetical protein AMATHDRAFT_51856 [Amanita thiersii Skay4041]